MRFSWATVKVILEREGHSVKWWLCFSPFLDGLSDAVDRIDEGQARLIQAFETGTGRDKNRCTIARDLGIKNVGSL